MRGFQSQKATLVCIAIVLSALFSSLSVASAKRTERLSWTFMVYLDADNSLDTFGPVNMEQIRQGLAPDANINVVVLIDRLNLPAFTYEITHEQITVLQDLGEIDMGIPETLVTFVEYAMLRYPAERYFLDLWDHGGGYRGVCWDESSGNHLSPHDIHLALSTVESRTKGYVQAVGFDACLMAMIEVAYELKDVTDVVLASEMLVPGLGWPYQHIMSYLSANPGVNAYTLSEEIVDSYVAYYPKYMVQLSAVDESMISTLTNSLSDFAEALKQSIDLYQGDISSARSAAEQRYILGTNGAYFYTELYKFTYLINQKVSDTTISPLAERLLNNVETTVFSENHTSKLNGMQYGLTINFPPNIKAYNSNYETYTRCFTEGSVWRSFLMTYYASKGH